jgi:cholesterol oxidase
VPPLDPAYDVVVVGSGFGGSVAALRLTEKGYRVLVVESGRRFDTTSLPRTSWQLKRFLWLPWIGLRGIQRMSVLDGCIALSGAGVGGGSLVYGNTLYRPPPAFYADRQWAAVTDWESELEPHYDTAERMLGVTEAPADTPADDLMRSLAEDLGVGESFRPTRVGVFLGEPGVGVPDPYFGGAGPDRVGCTQCGSCMSGCTVGAKNTLDRNYLLLAEKGGARVLADTTVVDVSPVGSRYAVVLRTTGLPVGRPTRTITAEQVVFAAGSLGTQRLLHRLRDTGRLPKISRRLGELTRTNSEAIICVTSRPGRGGRPRPGVDFTRGVAITSSFHPEPHTHIEPCRYGKGSNLMGLLATLLVDGGPSPTRLRGWWAGLRADPGAIRRMLDKRHWSERSITLLVMQDLDNSLTVSRRGRRLRTAQGHGAPNPAWIPVGHQVARMAAAKLDGDAGAGWGELLNVPLTGHIIGGCPIGATAAGGVVDGWHRLFGHPGLHVVDGSTLSANLGVNPSLTITAQAERAMSFWPLRGTTDPRPPLGSAYQRVAAVAPLTPAVPTDAPAALRWTAAAG